MVGSSDRSDLLFGLVYPSAMQFGHGADIFWLFLYLTPVKAVHSRFDDYQQPKLRDFGDAIGPC